MGRRGTPPSEFTQPAREATGKAGFVADLPIPEVKAGARALGESALNTQVRAEAPGYRHCQSSGNVYFHREPEDFSGHVAIKEQQE